MRTTTERNLDTGVTTVRISGELTRTTLTTVRAAIGKAAAECPTAVVVDLAGLYRTSPIRLSVFATASYQAQETWGVPVLFCAAEPEIRRDLTAFRSFVALYEYEWQAVTAVRAYVPRWVRRHLPPVTTSAAAARALLDEACGTWRLTHVRHTARLVVSELAANAILHAATAFDVTAAYTNRYLRIAVRDGSRAMPRAVEAPAPSCTIMPPGSGRGLRAVEAASSQWGVTRLPGGKFVWALIDAER